MKKGCVKCTGNTGTFGYERLYIELVAKIIGGFNFNEKPE